MIQIAASPLAVPAGPTRPVLLAAQSGASNFALALGSLLVPGAAAKAVPGEIPVADPPLPERQIVAEPGKELPEIVLDLAGDEEAPEQKPQADDDAPESDPAFAWFAAPPVPVADAAPIAVAPVAARKIAPEKPSREILLPEGGAPEAKAAELRPIAAGKADPKVTEEKAAPAEQPIVRETRQRSTQRPGRQLPAASPAVMPVVAPSIDTAAATAEAKPVVVPSAAPVAAATIAVSKADAGAAAVTPETTPPDTQPVRPLRSARFALPDETPLVAAQPDAQPAVESISGIPAEAPIAAAQPRATAPSPATLKLAAPPASLVQPPLSAAQPVPQLAGEAAPTVLAAAPAIIGQPVPQSAAPIATAPVEAPVIAPQFLRQPVADTAPVVRVEAPAVQPDAPVSRVDAPVVASARQPGLDAAQPATVASLIAHLPAQTLAVQPFAFTPLRRTLQDGDQPLVTNIAAPGAAILQQVAATPDAQQGTLDMRRQEWTGKMVEMIEAMREAAPVKETRISLMPDSLGKVDIAVRQDGDRVHVHFAAETQAARQILTDAQPRLAELAEARGIRLGQTSVDSGQAGANAQSGQRHNESQRSQTPSAPASARTAKDQFKQTDDRVA